MNPIVTPMIFKILYIHQPTRVTDHSETVIDNILSNISDYETVSGNITSLIADNFAQFLSIKKCYVSFKSCNYYVNDYTKFGREKLMTSLYWTGFPLMTHLFQ